jgi:hypothetical protein
MKKFIILVSFGIGLSTIANAVQRIDRDDRPDLVIIDDSTDLSMFHDMSTDFLIKGNGGEFIAPVAFCFNVEATGYEKIKDAKTVRLFDLVTDPWHCKNYRHTRQSC